jgi:hypothetical protein
LQITLPYNRHHFTEVWVVTTPRDHETMKAAKDCGAHIVTTDLFTVNGAIFNKYAALEFGLDAMGRHGWLAIMDADCLWPKEVPCDEVAGRVPEWFPAVGNLYTPMRRVWSDVTQPVPPEGEWGKLPWHHYQVEWSGYTQIFHAKDRHLGNSPWHEMNWTHAGGGDSMFHAKWPTDCKLRPPFEVVCLGPDSAVNWLGRAMPHTDGTLPPDAAAKQAAVREMLARRRGKHGNARFEEERISP